MPELFVDSLIIMLVVVDPVGIAPIFRGAHAWRVAGCQAPYRYPRHPHRGSDTRGFRARRRYPAQCAGYRHAGVSDRGWSAVIPAGGGHGFRPPFGGAFPDGAGAERGGSEKGHLGISAGDPPDRRSGCADFGAPHGGRAGRRPDGHRYRVGRDSGGFGTDALVTAVFHRASWRSWARPAPMSSAGCWA